MEALDEECQQYKWSLKSKWISHQVSRVTDDFQATLNETKLKYNEKLNQADYDKQQMEMRKTSKSTTKNQSKHK